MPTPTSGSAIDPAARELQVAELLDEWPWHLGAVVIGGYAVAAHGVARYSVEVDLVVGASTRDEHARFLRGRGLAGRLQDLGDLFTMDAAAVDASEIRSLLEALWCDSLGSKLDLVDRLMADPKVYRDVCSSRMAGSPQKRENARRWKTLSERIAACRPRP